MNRIKILTTLILFVLFLVAGAASQAASTASSVLKTPTEAFSVKNATLLVITLDIEKDWYTYADDPGDTGKPTKLSGTTADGHPVTPFYPEGIQKPDSFDPSVTINAYKNGTRLFALIPAEATAPFPITLTLDMLLCHPTKCVPIRRTLTFGTPEIDATTLAPAMDQPWWPQFLSLAHVKNPTAPPPPATAKATTIQDATRADTGTIQWEFTPQYLQPGLEVASLLSAVLMGILAGLILNIMPCVLPVISLKLSALLNAATKDEASRVKAFREHNIFFVLGILSFFLFLGIVLGGTGQAWGALFQNKWLVLGMAGLILAPVSQPVRPLPSASH